MGQAEGPIEVDGPDIQRVEIGGIPAFCSPPAPHYTGALVFRVGRADEILRHAGLTHLVEHLALHWVGLSPPYSMNGAVMSLHTVFYATGTPEEVAEFLGRVARALHDLPLERVHTEARVLRTESAQRPAGWYAEMMWMRFGAAAHGLGVYNEFELLSPAPERVRAWAAERFTAGNAALWFSGPPPATLELALPPGPRLPPPALRPVPNLRTPCGAKWSNPGVGISFLRPREDWIKVPLAIVANRLMTRLRGERGIAYDLQSHYEPLDAQTGSAALWGVSLPQHHTEVRDAVISTLEAFAAGGPTDEEMAAMKERARRDLKDAVDPHGLLMAYAMSELMNDPFQSRRELLADLDERTGSQMAGCIAGALESALLFSPQQCPPPPPRFHPYPDTSLDVVAGRSFRPANAPFPWSKGPRLVVGPSGVSIVPQNAPPVTVKFDALAAALCHPNGVIETIGEDGFRIEVNPGYWRNGHEVAIAMTAGMPMERVVYIDPEKLEAGPAP